MQLSGWIFMIVVWSVILGFLVWSMTRSLRPPKDKV